MANTPIGAPNFPLAGSASSETNLMNDSLERTLLQEATRNMLRKLIGALLSPDFRQFSAGFINLLGEIKPNNELFCVCVCVCVWVWVRDSWNNSRTFLKTPRLTCPKKEGLWITKGLYFHAPSSHTCMLFVAGSANHTICLTHDCFECHEDSKLGRTPKGKRNNQT